MSAQAIYDIFSSGDATEFAVQRIPSGPKSNCYFLLNLGQELSAYEAATAHRLKVQDRLRDGTGGWDDVFTNNAAFFRVENGILKSVYVNKAKNILPIFDLRAHRATYTASHSENIPSRKSVFWFWNSSASPCPGMALVAYLGPAYEMRPHGNAKKTLVPYQRSAHESIAMFGHRHKENTSLLYQEQTLLAASEDFTPPRNRQQVADAKHRERKASGVANVHRSSNFAQVIYK